MIQGDTDYVHIVEYLDSDILKVEEAVTVKKSKCC